MNGVIEEVLDSMNFLLDQRIYEALESSKRSQYSRAKKRLDMAHEKHREGLKATYLKHSYEVQEGIDNAKSPEEREKWEQEKKQLRLQYQQYKEDYERWYMKELLALRKRYKVFSRPKSVPFNWVLSTGYNK